MTPLIVSPSTTGADAKLYSRSVTPASSSISSRRVLSDSGLMICREPPFMPVSSPESSAVRVSSSS